MVGSSQSNHVPDQQVSALTKIIGKFGEKYRKLTPTLSK